MATHWVIKIIIYSISTYQFLSLHQALQGESGVQEWGVHLGDVALALRELNHLSFHNRYLSRTYYVSN